MEDMQLILYNARLRGQNGLLPETAMAVMDGKIWALGDDEGILMLQGEETECIDLKGATVYPGFGDSHMHLLHFGVTLREVELKDANSIEEVQTLCRAFIENNHIPEGTVVYAHGWNQDRFPDRRMPTRHDLDAVSTKHPIVAPRICGHIATGNTLALERFSITKDTRVPGGETYLDEAGEPTGIVSENAVSLLYGAQREVTVEEVKEILRRAADYAASRGITCVHSDDLHAMAGCSAENVIEAYRQLAREDALAVRVYEQCQLLNPKEIEDFFSEGHFSGEAEGAFSLYSMKIISDGSLGARTAYLREPYSDAPTTRGLLCYEPREIEDMVQAAQVHGMPVAVHAIGDAAMDVCLSAIERAQKADPEHKLRHGIVHCQITDEAILDRFAALGVQAYVQPVFLEYDAHIVEDRVGKDRAAHSYAWKSLLARGVNVSGGSDCPVEGMDSCKNLYCAMTRMDFDGQPAGGWRPEEDLSAQEALQVFTRNVAAASGEETRRGDLVPGFDADLTVLPEDFFEIEPARVQALSPVLTVMGGKVRFRA
ncbi:MAG: amidohydrolase [Candidatus Spyradocola sp.]|jgi:predicted amidohydrolase YtcJ